MRCRRKCAEGEADGGAHRSRHDGPCPEWARRSNSRASRPARRRVDLAERQAAEKHVVALAEYEERVGFVALDFLGVAA